MAAGAKRSIEIVAGWRLWSNESREAALADCRRRQALNLTASRALVFAGSCAIGFRQVFDGFVAGFEGRFEFCRQLQGRCPQVITAARG